jgi:hypothetical protein
MFKWFVKRQLKKFEQRWGYDTSYVREIVDDAGVKTLAHACVRVPIGGETVAVQRPQYA